MKLRILVSGGSIAGNTAAWWLTRFGHDVTVVEKAPDFRDGGQSVDVRGVGREVLRRMGLDELALVHGTTEEGTAWINEDGSVAAQVVTDELGQDGPTAELEILRGDLARVIYGPTSERATYRFGDTIKGLAESERGVVVTYASGEETTFDLVIVAEGVGSATRELMFPGENNPRWMDVTMAYFTIPHAVGDNRMWRWYNATEGRSISLRPDNHGTTRANLTIQQPSQGEQDWDENLQKVFMRDRFADAGWQADRILDAMEDTSDFYFDVLRQVHMKRWSKGRVVLTGDAAWCATPLAGIGTTLAVTGAYVLAAEIQQSTDIQTALARYEDTMRPMVEEGQGVPKIGSRIMNPHSRLGINLLHGVLSVATKPLVRGAVAKLSRRDRKAPDLSRYPSVQVEPHSSV